MKALIIEDETLAADRLQSLLAEVDNSIEVLHRLKSNESAIEWLRDHGDPDLIFCDIELLDGRCFEIFQKVEVKCPIIFTTAYDQFAIKAFEVNSVDYLLKPIKSEHLESSLKKLRSLGSKKGVDVDLSELATLLKKHKTDYKARFLVKIGQKIRSIPAEEIAYFFTKDKLSLLVTKKNDKYPVDQSLDDIEQTLNPHDFFRANRKYLVRINSITEIHPYFKGRVKINLEPHIDDDIVISSEKTPSFKQWLDK